MGSACFVYCGDFAVLFESKRPGDDVSDRDDGVNLQSIRECLRTSGVIFTD